VTIRSFTPLLRRHWLARPRLADALVHWRELRLIEVVAPAGYGKTTFTALWLHALSNLPAAQRPVVLWLALDPLHGGIVQFTQQLGEMLATHFPALTEFFALAHAEQIGIPQLVAACRRAIDDSPRPILLVIDDFHLAQDAEIHALIQALLDDAPKTLHLMLLSRTPPPLRVHQLVRNHTIAVLEEQDLRLDHEEFERFAAAASLPAERRREIEHRSAGWILGMHMLSTSSRTTHSAQATFDNNDMLAQFFDTEILARLSEPARSMLIATAVLPFLNISLVAAATALDPRHCAELLRSAAAANAFINVFGEDEVGYRLHPLFREHLLRHPDAGPALLRSRAATWLAEHDQVDAALDLLLPQLPQEAAAIVTVAGRRALLKHELADARRWMAMLPDAVIAASPRLALDAAWLCLFSEGVNLRTHVSRALDTLAAASDVPPELRGDAAVLDAWCLFLEGRADEAHDAVMLASRCLGDTPSISAAYLHILHTLTPSAPDDLYARITALQRSAAIFRQVGYEHGAAVAASSIAAIKLRYGDPAGALASFEYALGILTNIHFGRSSLASEMRCHYAEILLFMGRVDDARREFAQAAEFTQVVLHYPRTFMQLCDLYQRGTAAVDDAADAAEWAALVTSANPVMLSIIGVVRILRDYQRGRPERCWQTIESIGIFPHQLTPDLPDPIRFAVLAGAVLSNRNVPDLAEILQHTCDHLAATHNHWLGLRLRILRTIDLVHRGDLATAAAELQCLQTEVDRIHLPLLLSPFTELRRLTSTPALATQHLDHGLSAQEVRVLQLLDVGRSTDDIAAELFISRETVRSHLRKCFRKLNAHTRVAAITAARQAGIL
jgi:LuxR family maltose regulon positive regulatory protein